MNPLEALCERRKKNHTEWSTTVGRIIFPRREQFGSRLGVATKLVKFDLHTLPCTACVGKIVIYQQKHVIRTRGNKTIL